MKKENLRKQQRQSLGSCLSGDDSQVETLEKQKAMWRCERYSNRRGSRKEFETEVQLDGSQVMFDISILFQVQRKAPELFLTWERHNLTSPMARSL